MRSPTYLIEEIPRREFLKKGLKGSLAVATTPALLGCLVSGCAREPSDRDMLARTLRKALEKGGDFAEVYIENRISRSITMEESKFKSAVYGVSRGAGVRVIAGDKTGYAFTEEINEESLLRAAAVASYVARNGQVLQPVSLREASRDSFVTVKMKLQDIADDRRLEVMRRSHQAALDYDARIKLARVSYYDEVKGRTIANSEGLYVSDALPLVSYGVSALGVGDGTRHMGGKRVSLHCGFEVFDCVTPEDIAGEAAREAVAMLAAQDAPAGRMDVVIQNGWGGVLVHEAVGHPLEADNIAKKIGAFTGKLGQKVASDVFTMVDDGTVPNQRGTINFDDEGTQAKRNVLIEEGVLRKYMSDILSARQLDMERTGNGRRESFRSMPIPRMTNTFIAAGDSSPEDIIGSTEKGLYIQSLSGGSVNSVTGQFNFTCREAYLIEKGRKTQPVKGATLVGTSMEVISSIDAVGNDLDYGPGTCGKGGQSAEVSCGQPTVRIRGINVGGSRAAG
ncbi:MAG: TldD/PmbA family protein [Acidobacteriota bacterium]